MPAPTWRLAVIGLVLAALGCSVVDNITRPPEISGSLGSVTDLWDDVPRMDGLTATDEDLPVLVRVLVRGVLRNLTGDGESVGNWIIFGTNQTSADVQTYYTDGRMVDHGWEDSGQQTCTTGASQGLEQVGAICIFQKQVNNNFTALIILVMQGQDAGAANVVFLRFEVEATPEPPQ